MKNKAYSYIRFSTKEQLKGNSQQRQYEATRAYCQEMGLNLVENLQDLGLSAFNGKHKTVGALGEFLSLVNQGKIKKGSILIVENLDRLSREKVMDALNQFMSIVQAGIRIVTLHDRQEYDQESIEKNWTQLIISITYMARAHEESKTKSDRLKATLANKRLRVREGKQKFTGPTPAWLKYSPDKKTFILIPEVCQAIEEIYRMRLSGLGAYKIEKQINQTKSIWSPPVTKKDKQWAWRQSYIRKLLYDNRQLVGEFQPHVMVNGKRVPDGIPIKDYFPKAIPESLFYEVQSLIKKNAKTKGQGGGKTGKYFNLFAHIVKCGSCGSPMHYIDKGKPPKGHKYLHCDASRRKIDGGSKCQARAIRYDNFEKVFFSSIDELKLDEVFGLADEQAVKLNNLKRQMDVVLHRVSDVDDQIDNLVKAVSETSNDVVRQTLVKTLEQLEEEKRELLNRKEQLSTEIEEQTNLKETTFETVDRAKSYYQLIDEAKSEQQAIEIRFKLRNEIKKLIKEIRIVPHLDKIEALKYFKPQYDKFIQEYESSKDKNRLKNRRNSFQNRLKKMQNDPTNDRTYYGVAYVYWIKQIGGDRATFKL